MAEDLEKKGNEKDIRKGRAMFLAMDPFYISDLSDDGLMSLYDLIHQEFENQNITPSRVFEINDGLRAETTMRREFFNRNVDRPKKTSKLNKMFEESMGMKVAKGELEKQTKEETVEAETTEDVNDDHIHFIKELDTEGNGTTETAGDPKHSHAVVDFMTQKIEVDDYVSDHPGKVLLKNGLNKLRVTKRDNDGNLEWEADFQIIKKDEEKQLVAGVVYEPDIVDAQGDSSSAEEILKAAHKYMIDSQTVGFMHEKKLKKNQVAIVENFVAPISYIEGSQIVRKGSWVQVHKVFDKKLWKLIKDEKITGFSMAGTAVDLTKREKAETKEKKETVSLEAWGLILSKKIDLEKVIRRVDGDYCVFSEDGKKQLGCHSTRQAAVNQLAAIESKKNVTGAHLTKTKIRVLKQSITQEQMKGICQRCYKLMKKKKIRRIKLATLVSRNKFKRVFGIRRSSKGHTGLCRKYCSDPNLFLDHISKGKKK